MLQTSCFVKHWTWSVKCYCFTASFCFVHIVSSFNSIAHPAYLCETQSKTYVFQYLKFYSHLFDAINQNGLFDVRSEFRSNILFKCSSLNPWKVRFVIARRFMSYLVTLLIIIIKARKYRFDFWCSLNFVLRYQKRQTFTFQMILFQKEEEKKTIWKICKQKKRSSGKGTQKYTNFFGLALYVKNVFLLVISEILTTLPVGRGQFSIAESEKTVARAFTALLKEHKNVKCTIKILRCLCVPQ